MLQRATCFFRSVDSEVLLEHLRPFVRLSAKNLDQLYSSLNHHRTTGPYIIHCWKEDNVYHHLNLMTQHRAILGYDKGRAWWKWRTWRTWLVFRVGLVWWLWTLVDQDQTRRPPGSYLILSKTFEGLSRWAENRAVSALGSQKKIGGFEHLAVQRRCNLCFATPTLPLLQQLHFLTI